MPTPHSSQPTNAKGKGGVRRVSARITTGHQSPSSGSVKIGCIVVFPCGLEVLSMLADIPLANLPIPHLEPGTILLPSDQYLSIGPMGICWASS